MPLLRRVPPMGIYETLYAFQASFGKAMGEPGTHPWSQGYPLTTPIPGGPDLPASIPVGSEDLKYPKAWGVPALREAIASYYRKHYGARIAADNVMVFAGGRPAILAVLSFLESDVEVRVAATEYTPYFDMLRRLGRSFSLATSDVPNRFRPSVDDYASGERAARRLILLSNPCNPTGVTRDGDDLRRLVEAAGAAGTGLLVDEAYELFHEPPVSALAHAGDIDGSNLFVVGAATKGLQAPGIRVGWVVASRENVAILGNFSSFGMGGVSRPSQSFAIELLREERVERARRAIPAFYGAQRGRYGEALASLGVELHTGSGGFYHWGRLPGRMTAEGLNRRLFRRGAAILEGPYCDMARRGADSPLAGFFRFSFGPLSPESFEGDRALLGEALKG